MSLIKDLLEEYNKFLAGNYGRLGLDTSNQSNLKYIDFVNKIREDVQQKLESDTEFKKQYVESIRKFKSDLESNKDTLKNNPDAAYEFFKNNAPYFNEFKPIAEDIVSRFLNFSEAEGNEDADIQNAFTSSVINIFIKFLSDVKNIDKKDLLAKVTKDTPENIKLLKLFLVYFKNELKNRDSLKHVYSLFKDKAPYFEEFKSYLENYPVDTIESEESKRFISNLQDIFKNYESIKEKINKPKVIKPQQFDASYGTEPVEYTYNPKYKPNTIIENMIDTVKAFTVDTNNIDEVVDNIRIGFQNLGINEDYFDYKLKVFKNNVVKLKDNPTEIEKQFSEFINDVKSVYVVEEASKFSDEDVELQLNKLIAQKDDFLNSCKSNYDPGTFKLYYNNIHFILMYFKHYLQKLQALYSLNNEFSGNIDYKSQGKTGILIFKIDKVVSELNYIKQSKEVPNKKYINLDDKFFSNFESNINELYNDLSKFVTNNIKPYIVRSR